MIHQIVIHTLRSRSAGGPLSAALLLLFTLTLTPGISLGAKDTQPLKDSPPLKGELTLKDLKVAGDLDPKFVQRIYQRRRGGLLQCYKRSLKRKPTLSGEIKIGIQVSAAGKITKIAAMADTVGDKEMASCLLQRIKRWRFPSQHEGGTIEFLFGFQVVK